MGGERARAKVGETNVVIATVDQAEILQTEQDAAFLIEFLALIRIEAIGFGKRSRRCVDIVERLRDDFSKFVGENPFQVQEFLLRELMRGVGLDELAKAVNNRVRRSVPG